MWRSSFLTYPVLIISGCNPYSLAKTNGTIPCERAAWHCMVTVFQTLCKRILNKTDAFCQLIFLISHEWSCRTCTMAARSRTPLIPTATEVVDITIGPQMNRIAIAIVALFLPHTIIRGWRAMNNPAIFIEYFHANYWINSAGGYKGFNIPKLNMAIPRPASEIIFIEYFTKLGIPTFHLLISRKSLSIINKNHFLTKFIEDEENWEREDIRNSLERG